VARRSKPEENGGPMAVVKARDSIGAEAVQAGAELSTRERILDIALDLFIEKGFDKTSLREIADELGFSKAAIYYHFASKDEILLALHMRLHDFGHRAMERFGKAPASIDAWAELFDEVIDEVFANRRIFVLHQRNSAAFKTVHSSEAHDQDHEDAEALFRRVLADPSVPLRDRVRMTSAVGAIMGGLALSGELLKDVPSAELADLMREAVRDLLGGRGKRTRRTR
jgi:AcrR family transcriptional regulator